MIHFEVAGSGPAVLLTHGFTGSSADFAKLVGPLSKSPTVITWDLRGHRASDSPADPVAYSVEISVRDMKALLDRAGVERAALVGQSLGGYLSLAFHLAHPERVAALVLIGTGPRIPQGRGARGLEREGRDPRAQPRGEGRQEHQPGSRRARHPRAARRQLDQALRTRVNRATLLHHSDRGSPYASHEYRAVLEREGIVCSMSRRGDCWDNAVAESFFGTLKEELVKGEEFESRSQARAEIRDYVEGFYNSRRRHSSLGYRSPIQFEIEYTRQAASA